MVLKHRELLLPRQKSFIPPQIPNPFIHEINLTITDKIWMLLCGLIIFPLRLVLFAIVGLAAWLTAFIIRCCVPKSSKGALTGWKRNVLKYGLGHLGRLFYFSMGFHVRIIGKPASFNEAPIFVVAPHSSFFDAIAVITSGMPSILSRIENLSVPIFGSAFIPAVPIQPVILRYPNRLDTVTWTWQGYPFLKILLMTMCQVYTTVEIEYLPAYVPSEEEKKDCFLYAANVRSVMAKYLGVPVTDHTYEDCRLMLTARHLTLPMEAGLIEFTKIRRKLNIKWDDIQKQMEAFASIADSSKGGKIGIEEFACHLKLPVSDVLRELFTLFDRNKDGKIDFREYVIGMSVLCHPENSEENIQMAFKLFDEDNDGKITEKEFGTLLQCSLGVPDLEVSSLFQDMDADQSGIISYEEFKNFFLEHPEYAKLFKTYLEHQQYYMHMLEDENEDAAQDKNNITSHKKED
ncbi:lysophosphatidylcholine acyltransferase 2 isoform X2 [Hyperolius riggenbachi]|uniref:lysophosphatidylcholine acyltransferase 2 isoform X2 n=1 Tax=Hyperolius riggenbachi TaxID=752182 RepID=UPI0035A38937